MLHVCVYSVYVILLYNLTQFEQCHQLSTLYVKHAEVELIFIVQSGMAGDRGERQYRRVEKIKEVGRGTVGWQTGWVGKSEGGESERQETGENERGLETIGA